MKTKALQYMLYCEIYWSIYSCVGTVYEPWLINRSKQLFMLLNIYTDWQQEGRLFWLLNLQLPVSCWAAQECLAARQQEGRLMQLNLQRPVSCWAGSRGVSQQEGNRFRQLNLQRPVSCWAVQGAPRERSRAGCTWSPGTHAPPLAYPEGCSVPFAQYLRCCGPRIPFLLCSWDQFELPGSTIKCPKWVI